SQPLAKPFQFGERGLPNLGAYTVIAQFSPDGRQVVTSSYDGTARVWDSDTGEPMSPPLKHDDAIWPAEFSPDGQLVLTPSSHKSVRVWDTQSGQLLIGPLKHERMVWSARFSPDGLRIVSGAWDSTT